MILNSFLKFITLINIDTFLLKIDFFPYKNDFLREMGARGAIILITITLLFWFGENLRVERKCVSKNFIARRAKMIVLL